MKLIKITRAASFSMRLRPTGRRGADPRCHLQPLPGNACLRALKGLHYPWYPATLKQDKSVRDRGKSIRKLIFSTKPAIVLKKICDDKKFAANYLLLQATDTSIIKG
jgi:hypothetical protein